MHPEVFIKDFVLFSDLWKPYWGFNYLSDVYDIPVNLREHSVLQVLRSSASKYGSHPKDVICASYEGVENTCTCKKVISRYLSAIKHCWGSLK